MQMLREFFFPILKNSSFGTFFFVAGCCCSPWGRSGRDFHRHCRGGQQPKIIKSCATAADSQQQELEFLCMT
jgi:hypothetical protein